MGHSKDPDPGAMQGETCMAVLDAVPSMLVMLDAKLRVVQCNAACEELLGEAKDELLGRKPTALLRPVPLEREVRTVLREGGTKVVEVIGWMDRDAATVTRILITAPEPLHRSGHCLLRADDVTERVQLEARLAGAEKRAEELRVLARSIAHELGNPLTIMVSTLHYMDGLLTASGCGSLGESLAVLRDSLDQMRGLLENLSSVAATARKHFKPLDLGYLIQRTLRLFAWEAERNGIRVRQDIREGLPLCQGDPRALRALLVNLVKNAVESMPDGGELFIGAQPEGGSGAFRPVALRLEVRDTGVGIDQATMDALFKPFNSTKGVGHGLGLWFCQRVVEEHGGEIAVQSSAGQGARFVITLPLQ